LRPAVLARLGLHEDALRDITVVRRAWDARRKSAILLIYTLDCQLRDDTLEADVLRRFADDVHVRPAPDMRYVLVGSAPPDFAATQPLRPVVIGFGPCGMFAALVLAQMGLRPIVLERGKTVRERTKDTWGLWRQGQLNPDSNVQFGEGGAGTFSDGKLWSQISDPRHLTRKVLSEFVKAGAPEEILYVAKPHIGTFRLVSVVEHLRAEIEALGGEVRFQQQVVDVLIDDWIRARLMGARAVSAACACRMARSCTRSMSCWRSAIAPAIPSACGTSAACTWKPNRFPSASASNTRKP